MTKAARQFEPEVMFPVDPYAAACMYFGVMAYPEWGEGLPGARGEKFANSLRSFSFWATKQTKGVAFLREAFGDRTYQAPQRRQFDGAIQRGIPRVFRRLAAYDVVGTQFINGFFAARRLGARALSEGRGEEVFHTMHDGQLGPARLELWKEAMPTPQQLFSRSLSHWSDKLALNTTGAPADPQQKAKDLDRRAFQTSVPVLHMAHGLSEAAKKASEQIGGWGERNPVLALVMNANLWIWDAVDMAESWRLAMRFPRFDHLKPEKMIELKKPDFF